MHALFKENCIKEKFEKYKGNSIGYNDFWLIQQHGYSL